MNGTLFILIISTKKFVEFMRFSRAHKYYSIAWEKSMQSVSLNKKNKIKVNYKKKKKKTRTHIYGKQIKCHGQNVLLKNQFLWA